MDEHASSSLHEQHKIPNIQPFENVSNDNMPPVKLPSIYKKIDPMKNVTITFSAAKASVSKVLYALSDKTGLNIAVDDGINLDKAITANFDSTPVSTVLDILMNVIDGYYEQKEGILYIKKIMTKTFKIPYIHTKSSFKSKVGGDIFGSSSQASGLSGDFSLQFNNDEADNDFYKQLDSNVKDLLSKEGTYIVNKFSGIVTVTDTPKYVKKVEKLLNNIKVQNSKQVLIEARMIEVTLNDSTEFGIDWNKLFDNVANGALNVNQNFKLEDRFFATMTYTRGGLTAIIRAMSEAGKVKVLSNPRIKVTNGQSALISTGKIVPYWEKEVTFETDAESGDVTPTTTYNRRDVLDGLSLGVTAVVDDNDIITLNVVPVSSKIQSEKQHYDQGALVATAPILNIKEAGTIINAKNNELVLIGGLIDTTNSQEDKGVPLLSQIPFLNNFFSHKKHSVEKRELVILLKLKVLHNDK
jgi:MSHA biogenesis protein MshL